MQTTGRTESGPAEQQIRALLRRARSSRMTGISLTELLVVIMMIALVAAVVLPEASPTATYRLDLAAEAAAEALRHARSESMRTGLPYGVRIQPNDNRIRVFRGDTGTDPPTPVYDVYHPLSKQLHDVDLDDSVFAGAQMDSAPSTWTAACNNPQDIFFGPLGTPLCGDPLSVLLVEGSVNLSLGSETRVVKLDGETGRVTIP